MEKNMMTIEPGMNGGWNVFVHGYGELNKCYKTQRGAINAAKKFRPEFGIIVREGTWEKSHQNELGNWVFNLV